MNKESGGRDRTKLKNQIWKSQWSQQLNRVSAYLTIYSCWLTNTNLLANRKISFHWIASMKKYIFFLSIFNENRKKFLWLTPLGWYKCTTATHLLAHSLNIIKLVLVLKISISHRTNEWECRRIVWMNHVTNCNKGSIFL